MSMMIFSTLFFLGLFIMFFFILRNQDILLKTVRNELAQTRAKLHLVEMRLASLTGEEVDSNLQDLQMSTKNSSPTVPDDTKLELRLDSPINIKEENKS